MADFDVAVVPFAIRSGTGTQSIESAGFGTPKAALFFLSRAKTADTVETYARLSVGATDGTNEWSSGLHSADGYAHSEVARFLRNDCTIAQSWGGTSWGAVGEFSAWSANGITINWTTAQDLYSGVCVLFKGSDLSVDVDVIDCNAGDVTSLGFQPDVVLASCAGTEVSSSASDNTTQFALGFSDGTVQRVLATNAEKGSESTTKICARIDTNSTNQQLYDDSQTWDGTIASFDVNGFTATAASAGGDDFGYLALKIDGGDVWVGSLDAPTSTGDWEITSPGFEPKFAIILCSMCTSENSTVTDDKAGVVGVSIFDGTTERCISIAAEDNVGTTNTQSEIATAAIDLPSDDGTDTFDASFSSFDSNGWTLDFTAADGTTRKWIGLALGDGSAASGNTFAGQYYYRNLAGVQ